MNGHSSTPSPEQQGHGKIGGLKKHCAAHQKQENGLPAARSAQERSRQRASDAPEAILRSQGHDSASSQQGGRCSGERLGSTERSDGPYREEFLVAEPEARPLHPSMTDLVQSAHWKQRQKEGSAARWMPEASQALGNEQEAQTDGKPAGTVRQVQPGFQPAQIAEGAFPGSSPDDSSVHLPSEDAVLSLHVTAQQGHGNAKHAASRDLPVSVGAAQVSDDRATDTRPGHLPAAAQSQSTSVQPPALSQSSMGSRNTGQAEPGVPGQAPEPAWVSGFRGDMGLAMSTPFLQHSARFARTQHDCSSSPLPPANLGSDSSLESGGVTLIHEHDKHSSCIIPDAQNNHTTHRHHHRSVQPLYSTHV